MDDTARVRCPYCREWIELYVDPDSTGVWVEDCAVCCRPIEVCLRVSDDGELLDVHTRTDRD